MRGTLVPIPEFLEQVLALADADSRYDGIAVVLDRSAERSGLLQEVVQDAPSLDDVTGREILIVVPGLRKDKEANQPHWRQWTWQNPNAGGDDLAGGPGLLLVGARPLAQDFWERMSARINELSTSDEEQAKLGASITRSASETRKYLGLDEDDVPSLVLLCLREKVKRMFVIRFAKSRTAYAFFKEIRQRRPADGSSQWLADAVRAAATVEGLKTDKSLVLESPQWQGWAAERLRAGDVRPVRSRGLPG
ncbi:MAG: hypothetical protein JOZ87_05660 [Chloroflexi bacterium]|nr:hypothetical protein [Chloroflexota bacterium]